MLTPSFSKTLPIWENLKNIQTLTSYPGLCFWLIQVLLKVLKSLEYIFDEKIKFWNEFNTSQFLICWTFLFSDQNSVQCINAIILKKSWNQLFFFNKNFDLTEFSLTHFRQKFRESNGFTKEITKELIWRNIFSVRRVNFSFSHTCFLLEEYFVKLNYTIIIIWIDFMKFFIEL